eukprot:INCI8890.1.p1 GENE.INCI8890.1~~INCI8890.1.p1  ORF type:complete len:421 (-),score=59.21 INCI8890.1:182-1333(-)
MCSPRHDATPSPDVDVFMTSRHGLLQMVEMLHLPSNGKYRLSHGHRSGIPAAQLLSLTGAQARAVVQSTLPKNMTYVVDLASDQFCGTPSAKVQLIVPRQDVYTVLGVPDLEDQLRVLDFTVSRAGILLDSDECDNKSHAQLQAADELAAKNAGSSSNVPAVPVSGTSATQVHGGSGGGGCKADAEKPRPGQCRYALVDEHFLRDEAAKRLIIKHVVCPLGSVKRIAKYSQKGYHCPMETIGELYSEWTHRLLAPGSTPSPAAKTVAEVHPWPLQEGVDSMSPMQLLATLEKVKADKRDRWKLRASVQGVRRFTHATAGRLALFRHLYRQSHHACGNRVGSHAAVRQAVARTLQAKCRLRQLEQVESRMQQAAAALSAAVYTD